MKRKESATSRDKRLARERRYYLQKVDEKRCVCCGKQDERTLMGRIYCQACFDRHNANASPRKKRTTEQQQESSRTKREWMKKCVELNICILCGAKDKNTVSGHRLCVRCAAKRNQYQRAKYDAEARKEYTRNRRDRWREQGLCTYCGGKKEEPDKAMCIDCRVKARMQRTKRLMAKGVILNV